MSKKSFNDIEEVIKKLAETSEPAFDAQAWQKMEVLLDKEKERRKPFFWLWWLFPILLGAGIVTYFANKKNDITAQNEKVIVQKNDLATGKVPAQNIAKETAAISALNKNSLVNNEPVHSSSPKNTRPNHLITSQGSIKKTVIAVDHQNKIHVSGKRRNLQTSNAKSSITIIASQPETDSENLLSTNQTGNPPAIDKKSITESVGSEGSQESQKLKQDIVKQKTEQSIVKPGDTLVKNKNQDSKFTSRSSKFYFTISAGAEMSGVKLLSSGRVTTRFGLGVGYQFTKNMSVQTGFYTSSKKYVAGPKDYKTKPGTYWSMVDITKVDADCRVFELPVLFRYDFSPGKKINYFGSAGLSSFFMKKEDYHYYYYRYGTAHEASASYTGNQHLFSVLRIAAGVEKKLSSQFSLSASPAVSLPLAGVGEGQVKLYSADIMIGLKFSPSIKKQKQ